MKILCPVDFSKHSNLALEYAMHLSNIMDAELHVIYVYDTPKTAESFVSIDDKIKKSRQEDLEELLKKMESIIKTEYPIISNAYKGNPGTTIPRYADQLEIDLIVMGTQGNNSLRTILFGSVTRQVASKSGVPVLAIPEEIANRLTSNKMLLAIDEKLIEHKDVFRVPQMLAKKLNIKIDVLHVAKKESNDVFDPIVTELLGNQLGDLNIIEGEDPVKEIKKYVESNNIGMLIMVKREKTFFQRLLTVGNTSEEIAQTNIPLMVIPEKE